MAYKDELIKATESNGSGNLMSSNSTLANKTTPTTSMATQTGVKTNKTTTSSTTPVTGSGSTNPYYEMARKQNYTALLDKEIQLESARQNAMRLTNNQIAAQGLQSQGYGASANTGVNTSYMNALARASSDYQTNNQALMQQQYEEEKANSDDIFQSVTTMASQATDMETLNSLFVDYGYGSVDSEGNFAFGSKPEGMSDNDWNQLKYYYKLQTQAIENSAATNGISYNSIDSWKSGTYSYDGKTYSFGDKFNKESNYIWAEANAGKYEYGTTIEMTNADGHTVYIQWTENGFTQVTRKEFDKSDSKKSYWYGDDKVNERPEGYSYKDYLIEVGKKMGLTNEEIEEYLKKRGF